MNNNIIVDLATSLASGRSPETFQPFRVLGSNIPTLIKARKNDSSHLVSLCRSQVTRYARPPGEN